MEEFDAFFPLEKQVWQKQPVRWDKAEYVGSELLKPANQGPK